MRWRIHFPGIFLLDSVTLTGLKRSETGKKPSPDELYYSRYDIQGHHFCRYTSSKPTLT